MSLLGDEGEGTARAVLFLSSGDEDEEGRLETAATDGGTSPAEERGIFDLRGLINRTCPAILAMSVGMPWRALGDVHAAQTRQVFENLTGLGVMPLRAFCDFHRSLGGNHDR